MGMYSIIWNEGNGHAFSIWKNNADDENKYIMVSNDSLLYTNDYMAIWEKHYGGVQWLSRFHLDGIKIIFDGLIDL